MSEAKQYLSATVGHLREELSAGEPAPSKLAITWSVICDDDIAAGILRAAETGEATEPVGKSEPADVIAMATHGYSGIRRWAIGSITERVLHACSLPILVVRPAEMIEQHPQAEVQLKMVALP